MVPAFKKCFRRDGCCSSSNNALVVPALRSVFDFEGLQAWPCWRPLAFTSVLCNFASHSVSGFPSPSTSFASPASERRELPWVQSLASCFSHHFAIHIHSFNYLLCAVTLRFISFACSHYHWDTPVSFTYNMLKISSPLNSMLVLASNLIVFLPFFACLHFSYHMSRVVSGKGRSGDSLW